MSEAEMDVVEFWQERSAVIEYEAGKTRVIAESLALREVVARYGQAAGKAVIRYRERKQ